jgi:hypothetical protein
MTAGLIRLAVCIARSPPPAEDGQRGDFDQHSQRIAVRVAPSCRQPREDAVVW